MDQRQFQLDYGQPGNATTPYVGRTFEPSYMTAPEIAAEMAKMWYGRLIADPIRSMGGVGAGIIGNVPQINVTDATDLRRVGQQYVAQGGTGGVGDIMNALMLYGGPGIATGKPGVASVGIFGGEKAMGANLSMKAIAEKALSLGKDPDEVWKVTGWKPGMEGKMRFEISDKDMVVNPEFWGQGGARHSAWMDPKKNEWADIRMGDVVKHDAAYANYPEMKDVKVRLGQPDIMANKKGFFDETTNTATIKANLTRDEAREVLLHEVGGHYVQGKEGFARGGSVEGMAYDELNQLGKRVEFLKSKQNSIKPEYDAARSEFMRLYKNEGMEVANAWFDKQPVVNESMKYQREIESLTSKSHNIQPNYFEGEKKYRNLAGEIEANDIVNRSTWDTDMRRAVPPETRKDAIIRWGDKGAEEIAAELMKLQ
jgi:hypothetical protein